MAKSFTNKCQTVINSLRAAICIIEQFSQEDNESVTEDDKKCFIQECDDLTEIMAEFREVTGEIKKEIKEKRKEIQNLTKEDREELAWKLGEKYE